nr:mitogen-activated protein kinase kinase kinase 5 [Coffea arabica]
MPTTLSSPLTMKKPTASWLQNAFSFSSSSSTKSTSDDSIISGRYAAKPSLFSSRGGRSSRLLTRAKKLRHLTDCDVEFSRSTRASFDDSPARLSMGAFSPAAAAAAPPSPQPLPLPELQMLLRRDSKSASDRTTSKNVPLPSPGEAHQRECGAEEKEKEKSDCLNGVMNNDAATSSNAAGRLISQDAQKNVENTDNWSSRKSPPKVNGSERNPDNYRMSTPLSAPASPYASPALSPHRNAGDVLTPQYMTPPSLFQVWSAPEMPSLDSTLVSGFSYQSSSEIAAFPVDNSSLPSPKINLSKSPNGPASPLCNKLSSETSVTRHDCNAQASVSVHPLPLPPGSAMASQPTLIPQLTPKLDIAPIKSQWQKGKLIGRGTFGSVYVASNKKTGALCAMKEVEMLPDDPKSAECIRQLEQEIKVLSHLKHPNIVQYYGSEVVGDRFYIYLEYVHPGSINKFIHDHCGAITESVVRNFTRHILCGLAYLHSTKTIHRDIKGANLLVDAYGVVKLADFGMAKHLSGHAANLSLKGSPYWMAPELLQSVMQQDSNSDLALAIDIWSLGCTIIEMLNGKPPWSEYEGAAAMFRVLKETPPIPENLSAEGKDFLRCCFRRNPAERASASTLLEHRFVTTSHPPDILSCSLSLSGMKLRDDANSQRERSNSKLGQVPAYSDMHIAKGKVTDNYIHGSLAPVRLANDVATKL